MHTEAPLLDEPIAVELMNTIWADRDGVHDALATGAQVQAWLAAIRPRLVDGPVHVPISSFTSGWAAELRFLRDALRRIAADVTDDPRPGGRSSIVHRGQAVAALNNAAARAPRWTSLLWPRDPHRRPVRTVHTMASAQDALIAHIADDGIDLFTAADRSPLRACLAPGCVLYFVQHHARREWCSAACGNRARVARHYQRHRAPR